MDCPSACTVRNLCVNPAAGAWPSAGTNLIYRPCFSVGRSSLVMRCNGGFCTVTRLLHGKQFVKTTWAWRTPAITPIGSYKQNSGKWLVYPDQVSPHHPSLGRSTILPRTIPCGTSLLPERTSRMRHSRLQAACGESFPPVGHDGIRPRYLPWLQWPYQLLPNKVGEHFPPKRHPLGQPNRTFPVFNDWVWLVEDLVFSSISFQNFSTSALSGLTLVEMTLLLSRLHGWRLYRKTSLLRSRALRARLIWSALTLRIPSSSPGF